jgi:hypothetical protein
MRLLPDNWVNDTSTRKSNGERGPNDDAQRDLRSAVTFSWFLSRPLPNRRRILATRLWSRAG